MQDVLKFVNDFFSEIFSKLFEWLFGVVVWLINKLFGLPLALWLEGQGFNIEIPDEVFNVLNEITYCVGYILPLWALLPIVWFMLAFYIAKLSFAVFKGVTKFVKIG